MHCQSCFTDEDTRHSEESLLKSKHQFRGLDAGVSQGDRERRRRPCARRRGQGQRAGDSMQGGDLASWGYNSAIGQVRRTQCPPWWAGEEVRGPGWQFCEQRPGEWGARPRPRLGQCWLQSVPGKRVAVSVCVLGFVGWFSALKFAPRRGKQRWALFRGVVSRGHYQGLWVLPKELRGDNE